MLWSPDVISGAPTIRYSMQGLVQSQFRALVTVSCPSHASHLPAQVGDVETDHGYWGRPEQQPQSGTLGSTGYRPVWRVDKNSIGEWTACWLRRKRREGRGGGGAHVMWPADLMQALCTHTFSIAVPSQQEPGGDDMMPCLSAPHGCYRQQHTCICTALCVDILVFASPTSFQVLTLPPLQQRAWQRLRWSSVSLACHRYEPMGMSTSVHASG
jgi:hypothetical protein